MTLRRPQVVAAVVCRRGAGDVKGGTTQETHGRAIERYWDIYSRRRSQVQHLYARALAARAGTTALLAAIQDVSGAAVAGEKSIDRTVEAVYEGACGARL